MCGAAAAPYRAAATVEEPQVDAGLARHGVECAVGLEDLPCGRDHAAVLVGIGVAEHDFLGTVPTFEHRLVRFRGPQVAANCGRILEVWYGLEEGHWLQAWIVA